MAVGAALGAIIGPMTEGMASAAQYQASKHERNIAWRRQQAWELMAPSLRVEGLRRAGLNPVLAATQGMTGGPGHVAQGSPGQKPSFHYDHARTMASAKQTAAMTTELKILEQGLLQAQEKTRQEVQHSNIIEKYGMAGAERELLRADMEIQSIMAQSGLTSARQTESAQHAAKTRVDRLLMEMGIPGARAMEQMYEKHPWLRQLREFTGGGIGPAAIGAGAGALMRGGKRGVRPGGRHKVTWGLRGSRGKSRGGATYQKGNEYFDSQTGEVFE